MVVLYSTGCPKCLVLESKLKQKNINYEIVSDTKIMIEKGFTYTPMLEVNGQIYDFAGAVEWTNKQ